MGAHPDTDVIIQLVESEDGSISCVNLAGGEVLSVPPNTDNRELRHELANIIPVTNLHLINERGETLPAGSGEDVWGVMRGDDVFIPPASDNFVPIRVPSLSDWIWV